MNLTGADQPERLHGWQVSASFLRILRVPPLLGRGFAPDADQLGHDNKVVVIAHRLWQRRFGADTNIVGQTIRLNNESYTVVGVLSPKALVDEDCQFLSLSPTAAHLSKTWLARWLGDGRHCSCSASSRASPLAWLLSVFMGLWHTRSRNERTK